MAVDRPLLVIIGPTASGKSDLALRVAREARAEILSADSMQVYCGMDIGTAKPSPAERADVRHHLLDVVEPNQTFTVARFVELAERVIADAAARDVPLVITGGTPLYFKALFEGLFEGPHPDETLRARLRVMSNDQLARRLAEADAEAARRIHVNDTKRLIRALEVFELTGRPISSFQTDWDSASLKYQAVWVGLDWDREALNRRINARVKAMLAAGWVDETRRLFDTYGSLSPTAAEATGYHELVEHLAGRVSLEEATEQIKIATRQLARRQMKWFRRWRQVRWTAGDRPVEQLLAEVNSMWSFSR